MGFVVFNGVSSEDFHIQVETPPGYEIPEREYESYHVPGRNGDILLETGAYKNVKRTYKLAVGSIEKRYVDIVNPMVEWLSSVKGYSRLEDSYEPEYYRMAMYAGNNTVSNILGAAGRVDIVFNCKPQRYLKAGEIPLFFEKPGIIRNPTKFNSLPKITIFGSGEGAIQIGNYKVSISNILNGMIIDGEVQDCYVDRQNANRLVSLEKGFPRLEDGDNEITFAGGVTAMEVLPRWWTI